jgi:SAM-dependent methyltransferase
MSGMGVETSSLTIERARTEKRSRRIIRRALERTVAFLKAYGPSEIKRFLWDREFSGTKWNFIDNTDGDCVYPHIERHARGGSILDLGCGPGNTANELATTAYCTYVGVDISGEALRKARRRTEKNGRGGKNQFVQADFVMYVPSQEFDVILFRESLYHVPLGKVGSTLDRYSQYLKDGGSFIVKIFVSDPRSGRSKHRPKAMLSVIENQFHVVEKCEYGRSGPTVVVFRPQKRVRETSGTR